MKKSCYAIKQTKIEPCILSRYLSNKDFLAKDRGSLQVFEKFIKKKSHSKYKKIKVILSLHQNAIS